ncbi:HD-GYP domain-containing protein [Bacillus sp. S3]|uniref:HD-GYP domain-containing protein n=1 Tax=Bacillus sp. S3 TaxID=486398 RepID=UPI00118C7A15|nr:HD-GYP domain-containing protein [Bacillus sp. S3]QCJ44247.1 HD-GYP domain-containing protein [Bacillus sp. S3]
MDRKINNWLNNPVYFRWGFFILLLVSSVLYLFQIEPNHLYVFYILASVFLGIGFYQKNTWFLFVLTTAVVVCRLLSGPEPISILSFLILEFTYLLIMMISVGIMKRNQKINDDSLELIFALSKTLDSKDTYTSDHSQNAAWYAVEIAKKMNLPNHVIVAVHQGGLLHDIGKIGIPEHILVKPDKLTAKEYSIIKQHPVIGHEIIKHVTCFNENGVLDLVLYHHERYDGTGYPKGLMGNEIPLAARIMAIADTFDAMTSNRVYRNALSLEQALQEIKKNSGTQFDPFITDVFLSLFDNKQEHGISTYEDSTLEHSVGRKLS